MEIREEKDVLVVTAHNFDAVVSDDSNVLVEFYAPWCGHSKALEPEYAKAAGTLKAQQADIRLAKVDATIESKLAEKFGVQGFPTLKFFKKGQVIEYGGGRTEGEIVSWLRKKTGPPAVDLQTADDAQAFADAREVAVIGFFADVESDGAKAFIAAADSIDDIEFGICREPTAAERLGVEMDHVALFKKFDEGRAIMPASGDVESIRSFVRAESVALATEFSDEAASKIFGGEIKRHMLLFVSKSAEDFQSTLDQFIEAARAFKGKLQFIYIDVDVEDNGRILEFFGMQRSDAPAVRLIELSGDMLKYVTDEPLTADGFRAFATAFLDGELKPFLMSADIPAEQSGPVYTLVGKSFDAEVYGHPGAVFVNFYAPWSGHSKQLAPIWDSLGAHFAGDEGVRIARMDGTANEVESVKIQSFPTLKYFPAGGGVVDYNGGRTLDDLVRFVESGGADA